MPRVRGARAAAATTDDKPAAAASWPRRGRRGASRAVAEAAAGAGGGAPEPTAAAAGGKHPSPPKRVRKGRQPPDNSAAHAVQDTTTAEAEDAADPWPRLPSVVLSQVLALLSDEDVVSVGQTCRPWRRAALHPDVWRRRALDYWPTDPRSRVVVGRHPNYGGRWHRNARRFSRVIRFAPCLDTLRCNHGMLPAARKAVFTQSKCQPSALEINGSLVSALKYIKKWGEGLKVRLRLWSTAHERRPRRLHARTHGHADER
ncbi:hypothetical protein ONE63_000980 [Megalurothrips usitatus]|uniref:F-box domain-containing protein n=1 Tax=Megalurothrips usitatus TaxID=439358 RepID=A0AAV7Y660_9NEOP|nr:hypothetical protein ONE63_000980 [Megalurothrips usitatus]